MKRNYTEYDAKKDDVLREAEAAYRLEREEHDTDSWEQFWLHDDGITPPSPSAEFPRQGSYTVDDYNALPDDRRFELIDGYLFEMFSPSIRHQMILMELSIQIYQCIEEQGASCEVLQSPLDVQLDRDQWTMLQPDLMILCEEEQFRHREVQGAPEFVVEVLSPSSRAHDTIRKRKKYEKAGVKEYWIIDLFRKQIYIDHFATGKTAERYPLASKPEIGISEGRCVIDFEKISRKLEKYGMV